MKTDEFNDNVESQVQRLLRLKRHEQPPPGFYPSFAGRVMSRIEAEKSYSFFSNWRFWEWEISLSPNWATGMAVAFCAMLLWGISGADRTRVAAIGVSSEGTLQANLSHAEGIRTAGLKLHTTSTPVFETLVSEEVPPAFLFNRSGNPLPVQRVHLTY
jgi:hypothetical protein